MFNSILTLTLAAVIAAPPGYETKRSRKPNPFAPSLSQLTEAEEYKLDHIIDRFILADLGQITGVKARKARQAFEALPPDAIPALIRGMNRAALINGSCPAVMIGRKLGQMLGVTTDAELLTFARMNIGAGVVRSAHMDLLENLKVNCMLRHNVLRRTQELTGVASRVPQDFSDASPLLKNLRSLSTTALADAAGRERGPRLRLVLIEMAKRQGEDVVPTLGTASASYDKDIQRLARNLLMQHIERQSPAELKELLKDDRAEVRAAAARVVGSRGLDLVNEVVDLLEDEEASVRSVAQKVLVEINRGKDLGPRGQGNKEEHAKAITRWRDWASTRR